MSFTLTLMMFEENHDAVFDRLLEGRISHQRFLQKKPFNWGPRNAETFIHNLSHGAAPVSKENQTFKESHDLKVLLSRWFSHGFSYSPGWQNANSLVGNLQALSAWARLRFETELEPRAEKKEHNELKLKPRVFTVNRNETLMFLYIFWLCFFLFCCRCCWLLSLFVVCCCCCCCCCCFFVVVVGCWCKCRHVHTKQLRLSVMISTFDISRIWPKQLDSERREP